MSEFVSQQREEMNFNSMLFSELYRMLSDELSRKILDDVLRIRLAADSEYMNDYAIRLRYQYFEDFTEFKNKTFVEAGGFDGDNAEESIIGCSDYKKVYLFKSPEKNIIATKKRLRGRQNIDFGFLGFCSTKSTSKHFREFLQYVLNINPGYKVFLRH
jgi:hypothetical protein